MSQADPQPGSEHGRTLERLGLSDVRTVYQPVFDLRDGSVVGYEALVRGGPDDEHASPAQLFELARAEDVVAEFDAASARPPCAASSSTAPARSRSS